MTSAGCRWREFERLVAEYFRRRGYSVEETGSDSGDGGVDVLLHGDEGRILVQCKHWKERSVGVKVVRELRGAMSDFGALRGIVACFGHYTDEAAQFAERNGIEFIAGENLVALIQEVKGEPKTPQGRPRLYATRRRGLLVGSTALPCVWCAHAAADRPERRPRRHEVLGLPPVPPLPGRTAAVVV